MSINKKALGLLSIGVLIGTAAVVAVQTHAQQSSTQATQSQTLTAPATNSGDVVTPQDTDNIQDPGGIEKPDSTEVKDAETNDDQGNDKDTVPDNNKDDADETDASAVNQ